MDEVSFQQTLIIVHVKILENNLPRQLDPVPVYLDSYLACVTNRIECEFISFSRSKDGLQTRT